MKETKDKVGKLTDNLFETRLAIEKARIIINDLAESYFRPSTIKITRDFIISNFEKSGITLDIVTDYVFEAFNKILEMEKECKNIHDDLTMKVGDTNEYTTKNEKSAQCIYGAKAN